MLVPIEVSVITPTEKSHPPMQRHRRRSKVSAAEDTLAAESSNCNMTDTSGGRSLLLDRLARALQRETAY